MKKLEKVYDIVHSERFEGVSSSSLNVEDTLQAIIDAVNELSEFTLNKVIKLTSCAKDQVSTSRQLMSADCGTEMVGMYE